jgi:hypothetical protein
VSVAEYDEFIVYGSGCGDVAFTVGSEWVVLFGGFGVHFGFDSSVACVEGDGDE